jgi:hypothetical protein
MTYDALYDRLIAQAEAERDAANAQAARLARRVRQLEAELAALRAPSPAPHVGHRSSVYTVRPAQ